MEDMSPNWLRLLSLVILALTRPMLAAEPSAWPLWDMHESVADYAKRVNLPATQTLNLSGGEKLELELVPAGQFLMGTPEPIPVDEVRFHNMIITGQALLAASSATLLVILSVVIIRAIRNKRRPQLSLGRLLLITVATGGCVLSGLHWRHSAQTLAAASAEYAAASLRFNSAHLGESPVHLVTLTQPFYMGKFAVTQEQYSQVIGSNPSLFKGKNNPVENVSWNDAQMFCKKFSGQMNQTIRLPTEAEWEYACRAGTATTYYSGDTEADLAKVGWYLANSKSTTHPAGQKASNAFGLHDMHGNVWQWCQDWYTPGYYEKSAAENPQGPTQGEDRSIRGGAWYFNPMGCRSGRRGRYSPESRFNGIGFRVVLAPAFRSQ